MNISELITYRAVSYGDKDFLLFERQPGDAERLDAERLNTFRVRLSETNI